MIDQVGRLAQEACCKAYRCSMRSFCHCFGYGESRESALARARFEIWHPSHNQVLLDGQLLMEPRSSNSRTPKYHSSHAIHIQPFFSSSHGNPLMTGKQAAPILWARTTRP